MIKKSIHQSDVVELLNEALLKDPECLKALFEHRVPCNSAIAHHPTIQVQQHKGQKVPAVGLLGILNGLFGIGEDGFGAFAMEIDEEGNISKFLTSDELKPRPAYSNKFNYEKVMENIPPEHQTAMEAMTCYKCEKEPMCKYAWAPYNTDGDCLMEK